MEEIKTRIDAIVAAEKRILPVFKSHLDFEFMALQFRKIFETIILSSVESHEGALLENHPKIFQEWDINKVVAIVRRINPEFYPQPVTSSGVEIVESTEEFLTLRQLKRFHGRCNPWLHSKFAHQQLVDYGSWQEEFRSWRTLVIALLNTHLVQLADQDEFLLIGMKHSETGRPHFSMFQKIKSDEAA